MKRIFLMIKILPKF